MRYRVLRTDRASDQFYSLLQYIADDTGDIDLALRYLDRMEDAIMRLEAFPLSGTTPRYSILKKQGYRVLIFEKQLVFYKVDEAEKAVTIHAVVDGRMEYRNLI